ncbi:hypothetical protein V6N11_033763 [Hibiscus sabdariffa]|uniref:Uncharacterized protein n=1 Tax=Hibiscus sabdariffa TaxID=183260 RepID=A0ABR2S0G6_9ROSI
MGFYDSSTIINRFLDRRLLVNISIVFIESFEEPEDEPNFDCSSGWQSSWNSVEDPSIHIGNNPWEQPPFGNVSEQPPMYGGSSSSQHAYTDDMGYCNTLKWA